VRHRVYGKHLSRSKDQRTALFKSLVRSLILEESIKTTAPKAKAIKGLVDRIITQAKSVTSKKMVAQFLPHKVVLDKLNNEILPRVSSRNSGYTSTVRIGSRMGDGAMIVKMSLILDEAKSKVSKVPSVPQVPRGEETKEKALDTRGTLGTRGTSKLKEKK
jgi:large subunit ribosomal protein L17